MLRSITITVTVDNLDELELARLRDRLEDFIDCGAQFIQLNVRGGPSQNSVGLAELLGDVQRKLALRRGMISARTIPVHV
jgi:hypothetical protein